MGSKQYEQYMHRLARATAFTTGFFLLLLMAVIIASIVSVPPPISIEDREYTERPAQSYIAYERGECMEPTSDQCCPACAQNNKSTEENSNEFISSKRDLNAQEGVWRASNAMAYLTAVATVIGVCGLYLLGRTLQATSDTLAATQVGVTAANRTADAAENAERAYLFIEIEREVECDRNRKMDASVCIYARLSNYGHTPAKNVEFEYSYTTHGVGNAPIWPAPEVNKQCVMTNHEVKVIGPSNRDTRVLLAHLDFPSIIGSEGARIERIFAIRVSYDTVFYERAKFDGKPEFMDEQVFRAVPKGFMFSTIKRDYLYGRNTSADYNFNSVDGVDFEHAEGFKLITREEFDEQERVAMSQSD